MYTYIYIYIIIIYIIIIIICIHIYLYIYGQMYEFDATILKSEPHVCLSTGIEDWLPVEIFLSSRPCPYDA